MNLLTKQDIEELNKASLEHKKGTIDSGTYMEQVMNVFPKLIVSLNVKALLLQQAYTFMYEGFDADDEKVLTFMNKVVEHFQIENEKETEDSKNN